MKLKLTLYHKLYLLIYSALKEKFIEREWPRSGGLPGGMYGIWEKPDPAAVTVIETLFEVNFKFFYNHNIKALKGKPITIYNKTLSKVLDYIGCKGPNGPDIAAQIEAFYRVYTVSPDIIKAQDSQKQEKNPSKNEAKKSVNISSVETTQQNISAENISHKTIHNYYNVGSGSVEEQNEVTTLVYAFYEHIATGSQSGFEAAWELLSESFRERIWGKKALDLKELGIDKTPFEHFKDGYYFFRSLKETHVFNTKLYPSMANCMVYFEEELELPHIEELADINKTSIKNAHMLIDKIKAVAGVVERFGGNGFADKALMRLFYLTPTETIWFEHGLDHVAFKKAFPMTTTNTISRLFKCRCIKENDQWFINGLVSLQCRQL